MNINLNITTKTSDLDGFERTDALRSDLLQIPNMKLQGLTCEKKVGEITPNAEVTYVAYFVGTYHNEDRFVKYVMNKINTSLNNCWATTITINTPEEENMNTTTEDNDLNDPTVKRLWAMAWFAANDPESRTAPIAYTAEEINPTNKENTINMYNVYFRLDTDKDWDLEESFDTPNQALHYIRNAKLAAGEFKVEVEIDGLATATLNIKDTMHATIYEYAYTPIGSSNEIQVITNSMNDKEGEAFRIYRETVLSGRHHSLAFKEQKEADLPKVQAHYTSPSWDYTMMMERVVAIGGKFRIEKHDVKEIDAYITRSVRVRASFAFVEGTSLNIIIIADASGDLVKWADFQSYMGTIHKNGNKMGKRAKEYTRKSLFGSVFTHELDILNVEFPADMEKAIDGSMVMSQSCFRNLLVKSISDPKMRRRQYAKLANGGICRGNIRFMTKHGLIKGDAIIVEDATLIAKHGYAPDMIQPTIGGVSINLKKELSTDGTWNIMTINVNHGHTAPTTNDPLLSILMQGDEPWALNKENLTADLNAWHDEAAEELKAGVFPTWMTGARMDPDTGAEMQWDSLSSAISSQSMQYHHARKEFSDTPLLESGFYISMLGGNRTNYLDKAFPREGDGSKSKKIMIPIGWAAYMHVTSLSIIEMAGFDPASEGIDTSKCFYYPKAHSWVKPDAIFIRDYARHGGEDGDDSEIVMVRNFRMPDGSIKIMAIAIRMPTARGEYSIVDVDTTDFPFYHTWNVMPTVNYADRPEFLDEMNQDLKEMPTSGIVIPSEYTEDWCMEQVALLVMNPGVGTSINAMIAYSATMSGDIPNRTLSTEDIVDTCQQHMDEASFVAIRDENFRFGEALASSGGIIDKYIWDERVKGSIELAPGSGTTIGAGFYSEMYSRTHAKRNEWVTFVNTMSTKGRKVIKEAMELKIPETVNFRDGNDDIVVVNTEKQATTWIKRYFQEVRTGYHHTDPAEVRREFCANLNRDWVSELLAQSPRTRNYLLISMYQLIINSNLKDKFFFQTAYVGEDSTMDLFLGALVLLKVANPLGMDN